MLAISQPWYPRVHHRSSPEILAERKIKREEDMKKKYGNDNAIVKSWAERNVHPTQQKAILDKFPTQLESQKKMFAFLKSLPKVPK